MRGDTDERGGTGGEPPPDDPVELPIEDSLDLHTFHPRDIPDVVREYLREASARGLREVRIIHGKGTGVQREAVAKVLRGHPLVESFETAGGERGHWGATVARLRTPPA